MQDGTEYVLLQALLDHYGEYDVLKTFAISSVFRVVFSVCDCRGVAQREIDCVVDTCISVFNTILYVTKYI